MSEEVQKEDWMAKRWRPAMGWLYMAVCACDFMLFPVLWSIHQALNHGQISSQWQPLTLQGAGLFHLAMGAVLGIAAYGRTQEKLAGAEQGGLGSFGQGAGTTYTPPASGGFGNATTNVPSGGFTAPSVPQTGFGAPAASTSFTSAPSWGTTPTVSASGGFGSPTPPAVSKFGKVVPQADQPAL
jgi:hypothetical protein